MPDFVRYILGGVLLIVLIGLFIFTYLLNKKTPKPEGCQNLEESCEGCKITSCLNRKDKKEEEESL